MTDLFLKIVNISIFAGRVILAVLLLRMLLKRAPKWINVTVLRIIAAAVIVCVAVALYFLTDPAGQRRETDPGEGNVSLQEGDFSGQPVSGAGGDAGVSQRNNGLTGGGAERSVSQDAAIWSEADLDHDGENEFILIREHNGGEYHELEVVKQDGNALFQEGEPLEFLFASGAGGWGTTLTLYPDGHFEGIYGDGEAVVAPEYPRGTVYFCRFSGSFGEMTQISDYAYSMQLEELNCETEVDQVWIEDEIRYIGSEALGVEGGEEFILYLPETSPEGLNEEFLSWWPDAYLWRDGSLKQLSSYGLQNVNTGQGFFTSWLQ